MVISINRREFIVLKGKIFKLKIINKNSSLLPSIRVLLDPEILLKEII